MNPGNDYLYSLINGDMKNVEIKGPPINPFNQQTVSITSNKNPQFPDDPGIKNYSWALQEFGFDDSVDFPLLRKEIFNSFRQINSSIIQSDNGNLSVFNVPEKTLQVYSANIFCKNSNLTTLNIDWNDSISVYFNDSLVVSNFYASGYNSEYKDISLQTGLNTLQIYLYNYSGGKSFTINNELGDLVDGWYIPNYLLPQTPRDLVISNDLNSSNLKDPNLNIVEWDKGSSRDNQTLGYTVFRRGPYNSGLAPLTNISYSGHFVNGLSGYNQFDYKHIFYRISSENSAGESLPSVDIQCIPSGEVIPPILTGFNERPGGTTLLSGNSWEYALFARTSHNQLIWNQPTIYPATNSVVDLYYNIGVNYSFIDIYRMSGISESGAIRNPTRNSYDGYLIATVSGLGSGIYTDYGITSGTYVSGSLTFLGADTDPFYTNRYYNDNVFKLSWPALTTGVTYNIYKSNYSGIYKPNSFVGSTTGTFFIDSGLALEGQPIDYTHIGVVENDKKFNDVVITNRTYDYKVSAFNFSYINSPLSSGYTITAGDPFPPATPSGITITSFNGFATLGWMNGNEPDLQGTHIWRSDDNTNYNIIGTTQGTTFSTFIGYSGTPYFKLSNFDTSDNESPLSAAYQGSGTFVAESIQLTRFRIMSSPEIDFNYQYPSGYYNITTGSITFSSIGEYNTPFINQSGNSKYIYGNVTSNNREFYISTVDTSSLFGGEQKFGPVSGLWSGVAVAAVAFESNNPRYITAFYSGESSNGWFNYATYSGNLVAQSLSLVQTFQTGFFIGDWATSGLFAGQPSILGTESLRARPMISCSPIDIDRNVIGFLSGRNVAPPSFGFMTINSNGFQTGIIKYFKVPDGNINKNQQPDIALDSSGIVHIVWMGESNNDNFSEPLWYKLNYNSFDSSPITILASGKYSNGNGARFSGYLFPGGAYKGYLEQARLFFDSQGEGHVFLRETSNSKRGIVYSKIDENGNILMSPNLIYRTPFSFNQNDFDFAYAKTPDAAYSIYNLVTEPTGVRNSVYNFKPGIYNKIHEFETFTNSSLYQILQSITK